LWGVAYVSVFFWICLLPSPAPEDLLLLILLIILLLSVVGGVWFLRLGSRLDLGGDLASGGYLPGFVMFTTRASLALQMMLLLLLLLPLHDQSVLCLQRVAVLRTMLPALLATAGHRNGSRLTGLISALGLVLLHQELGVLAGVRRGVQLPGAQLQLRRRLVRDAAGRDDRRGGLREGAARMVAHGLALGRRLARHIVDAWGEGKKSWISDHSYI